VSTVFSRARDDERGQDIRGGRDHPLRPGDAKPGV
jgi:hypothetical protein